MVVIRLLWLSGRALAAQVRGVLGSTPGGCQPFHFASYNTYNGGVKTIYIPCRHYMLPRYVSIWCLQASNTPSVLTSTQYDTTPINRARAMVKHTL